jgi:hypothetical protein
MFMEQLLADVEGREVEEAARKRHSAHIGAEYIVISRRSRLWV